MDDRYSVHVNSIYKQLFVFYSKLNTRKKILFFYDGQWPSYLCCQKQIWNILMTVLMQCIKTNVKLQNKIYLYLETLSIVRSHSQRTGAYDALVGNLHVEMVNSYVHVVILFQLITFSTHKYFFIIPLYGNMEPDMTMLFFCK